MGSRWVALLRGVNVGTANRLAMGELRASLSRSGLIGVRTYIQTGNVVFDVDPSSGLADDEIGLSRSISATIEATAGLRVAVVVRRLDELARIARSHPDAEGVVPAKWLHVFVLDRGADPAQSLDPARFDPDRMVLDGREIYATYPSGSGRSKLTINVVERTFGVVATARNLVTIERIVALGEAGSAEP